MQHKVAVLMGGRSGEHEVSLQSARYIMDSLKEVGHSVLAIGITNDGQWLYHPDIWQMLVDGADLSEAQPVSLDLNYQGLGLLVDGEPLDLDIVFPVLHGPFGEDGTVQGALELSGVPYVGSGVLGSAVGMDKVQMKIAFRARNLPMGSYIAFNAWEWDDGRRELVARIEERLGTPLFVKPANLGSSVGISKVTTIRELLPAVEEALKYDSKIIVEAGITGREIECSVLGNEHARASVPGEIVPANDFYDYSAKYLDEKSRLIIPAQLPDDVTQRVRDLAVEAFHAVDAAGLARVDMFVKSDGSVYLNEINTMPGFTAISMYPKLWEASGLGGPELVNRLVELGLARHWRRGRLQHKRQEDNND
ncbi:MAG: D-alanine--D-alanine ligase [Firmicutes bacterium]|nr:D-alanine--D-alanine ligase [Bacillota bacterium]